MNNIKTYHHNVTGVRLANGDIVEADYIISNMEVIPTYKYLLHFSQQRSINLKRHMNQRVQGM